MDAVLFFYYNFKGLSDNLYIEYVLSLSYMYVLPTCICVNDTLFFFFF